MANHRSRGIRIPVRYAGLVLSAVAVTQFSSASFAADPYLLQENAREQIYKDTGGLQLRNRPIDPAERTAVVFHAGQSNRESINPTLYVPPHTLQIDNFNIGDGQAYEINGPMLGTSFADPPRFPGNVSARIDELLIANGIADRVISVTIAVGGSGIKDWSEGRHSNRFAVATRRLAARGIAPGPNVKFIVDWSQGPTDSLLETPGPVWGQEFLKVVANAEAAGFSGVWYVSTETWMMGVTAPMVQSAQAAVCDGVKIFQSFNSDLLGQNYRSDGAGHFNDLGAATVALGVVTRIQASRPLF